MTESAQWGQFSENTVIFRTFSLTFRTNPVISRTNQVIFRIHPVIFIIKSKNVGEWMFYLRQIDLY